MGSRALGAVCGLLLSSWGPQGSAGAENSALTFTESLGLPGSKAQLFGAAQEAWSSTFGAEPGGHLLSSDAENGVIEGVARINFRSAQILNREETMGVIAYHVRVQCENGHCTVRIWDLKHVGNHNAKGGGLDIGPVLSGVGPSARPPGMGWNSARRTHAELQAKANEHLPLLIRNFLSQVRFHTER